MQFTMSSPCKNCPFREDITFYLDPIRTTEILRAILEEDRTFICHTTINYDNVTDVGDTRPTGKEQHCAGALIMAERLGRPNQMMRIAERLRLYDRHKLDMKAPVFGTAQAMLARMQSLHRGDKGDKHEPL